MIELTILKYLAEHLEVPVFLEHQEHPPKNFVIFEKLSGGYTNKLHSASFAFQSYGESMYEAARLNEEVKKVVLDMIELDEFSRIKLNSDYNYTDTSTKRYRYQAVFDMNYYDI